LLRVLLWYGVLAAVAALLGYRYQIWLTHLLRVLLLVLLA